MKGLSFSGVTSLSACSFLPRYSFHVFENTGIFGIKYFSANLLAAIGYLWVYRPCAVTFIDLFLKSTLSIRLSMKRYQVSIISGVAESNSLRIKSTNSSLLSMRLLHLWIVFWRRSKKQSSHDGLYDSWIEEFSKLLSFIMMSILSENALSKFFHNL